MNGGYAMIDGTGINLSVTTAQEIDGIYEQIYNAMSTDKPLLFTGVLMENTGLMTPTYGTAYISGETIRVLLSGKNLTVTTDDNVTVASNATVSNKGGK